MSEITSETQSSPSKPTHRLRIITVAQFFLLVALLASAVLGLVTAFSPISQLMLSVVVGGLATGGVFLAMRRRETRD